MTNQLWKNNEMFITQESAIKMTENDQEQINKLAINVIKNSAFLDDSERGGLSPFEKVRNKTSMGL